MGFLNAIGFRTTQANNELPEIYPFPFVEGNFVKIDVRNIYQRILTDVLERTQGMPTEFESLLWDNCLKSESNDGLVSMLAKAMTNKEDLFIVLDKGTKVIRKATNMEQDKIKKDYEASAKSDTGTFITFRNFDRSDMVKLYSALEYCAVAALHKSMNLSKAIQIKLTDLRSTVGLSDKADVIEQMKAIAEGLKKGLDVGIDAKDSIVTVTPDLTAAKASMDFIAQKRSFYLGLPASYITGESSKGLGDSGMGDSRAIERGLKAYFFPIVKPVIKAIFDKDVTFESEDFDQLDSAVRALQAFDATSDEHLSKDNKTVIVNKLFGLDEGEVGDAPEKPVAPPVVPAALPPPKVEANV